MPQSHVRFIVSGELLRDLPKVVDSLETPVARFVLTVHSKPKAVLIGAEAFLALLRRQTPADRLLALQLGALVQGLEASTTTADTADPQAEARLQPERAAVCTEGHRGPSIKITVPRL